MNDMPKITDICASDITRAAGLETGPVPSHPYYSPEYFELERDRPVSILQN